MGAAEVGAFVSHRAVNGKVAASTQDQALAAIVFLYREVLAVEVPWLDAQLDGVHHLVASLLCGSGLRLMEAIRLRVKEVDVERLELIGRGGEGGRDRGTALPRSPVEPMQRQLGKVRLLHEQDLCEKLVPVYPPCALERKCPRPAPVFLPAILRVGIRWLVTTARLCVAPRDRSACKQTLMYLCFAVILWIER